ncbi:30S ribosomal protein S4 [Candidatus Micrarchaeota archaeon CG10_big_fil_rev_8_21_14_0_10_45_29]|nr:MAG: 30S ribosomal protein S4 [Candidatus Micrarchaeota archaeon CG10_big_fil_rev_8_21_14_0_10_45_29]
MGDPKRRRPKAQAPRKVWDSDRIKEESTLRREYGLRRTRELWTTMAGLKSLRNAARQLLSLGDEGERRGRTLVDKLKRIGIAKKDMTLDDILALSVRDFLERRLQTLVLKRGLARTPAQARQLIVHGFISVGGRRVNIPSYVVNAKEESTISYFKAIDISIPEEEKQEKPSRAKAEEAPAKEGAPALEAKAEGN